MDSLHTACISIDCGLLFVPICAKTRGVDLSSLWLEWSGDSSRSLFKKKRTQSVSPRMFVTRSIERFKSSLHGRCYDAVEVCNIYNLHFSRLHLLSGFGRALAPDLQNRNFVYRTELYTSLQCSPGIHT